MRAVHLYICNHAWFVLRSQLLLQHIDLALPQEMIDGMGQFKQFYEATSKHRNLGWVYALGTCHVKGNFDARPVELILTTFQATLLLLFNTG